MGSNTRSTHFYQRAMVADAQLPPSKEITCRYYVVGRPGIDYTEFCPCGVQRYSRPRCLDKRMPVTVQLAPGAIPATGK